MNIDHQTSDQKQKMGKNALKPRNEWTWRGNAVLKHQDAHKMTAVKVSAFIYKFFSPQNSKQKEICCFFQNKVIASSRWK